MRPWESRLPNRLQTREARGRATIQVDPLVTAGDRTVLRSGRSAHAWLLDMATRAKDDPRLGASARVLTGRLQRDGYSGHAGDPDAALATWRAGLERFGADAGLRDAIIDFYLARGDLRDARTYLRDGAQDQGWQATMALETVPAIDEGMQVRPGGLQDRRSALFLAYLFRLLENGAHPDAAGALATCLKQGFWAGDILSIALELDGRGGGLERGAQEGRAGADCGAESRAIGVPPQQVRPLAAARDGPGRAGVRPAQTGASRRRRPGCVTVAARTLMPVER